MNILQKIRQRQDAQALGKPLSRLGLAGKVSLNGFLSLLDGDDEVKVKP